MPLSIPPDGPEPCRRPLITKKGKNAKWFLNRATRGKLYVGFGLTTGFLLTVIVAYFAIADIRSAQEKLYRSEFANATDLLLLRNHQNGARAAVLNLILNANRPADRDRWYQDPQAQRRNHLDHPKAPGAESPQPVTARENQGAYGGPRSLGQDLG